MKRIFSILFTCLLLLCLCSCTESINMGVLTEYQKSDFRAELKLSAGGKEYRAEAEKRGERILLTVKEPEGLGGLTFILGEGTCAVKAGDAEIPLDAGGLFPLSGVFALFSVPVEGTWKIERSRPGGVDVYVCENGSTVLYIDASSRLPLKITCGSTEADVLSFTAADQPLK